MKWRIVALFRIWNTPSVSALVLVGFLGAICALSCNVSDAPPIEDAPPSGIVEDSSVSASASPNVLWITMDTCRARNLSFYGYERETSPNLAELAAEGVIFENAWAQAPFTALSVPSYITGRYFPVISLGCPTQSRLRHRPPYEKLFPEIASENGYRTYGLSSHWGMTESSVFFKSFDDFVFFPSPEKFSRLRYAPAEVMMPAIQDKIRQAASSKIPFFMYLHFLDPHFPHWFPEEDAKWGSSEYESAAIRQGTPIDTRKSAFTREDIEALRAMHDGSIHYLDRGLGMIVALLKELDIFKNTIIVVNSDHGDALGEDGTTWGHINSADETLHVPLIMAGPGLPRGVRQAELAENADIVPTLVELLNFETSAQFHGRSLLPLLCGDEKHPWRDYTFSAYRYYETAPSFIVRTHGYKLLSDPGHTALNLWRVPDELATRVSLTGQNPEVKDSLMQIIDRDLRPIWDIYQALPKLYFDIMLQPENASALGLAGRDDVVILENEDYPSVEHVKDGAWTLTKKGLYASGAEEAPELRFAMSVPNGHYLVYAVVVPFSGLHGMPGSDTRVRIEDQDMFTTLTVNHIPGELDHPLWGFIGTAQATQERIMVYLQPGAETHWTHLALLRLLIDTPQGYSEEEIRSQEEQMRALGYL